MKHVAIKPQSEKLVKLIYEFLKLAHERRKCITGPTLKLLAIEKSKVLSIENFMASDGWLSKFKSRHGIKANTISGEVKAVDTELVVSWKTVLPTILVDYDPSNVFTYDETGLLFNTTTDRSLILPGDDGNGNKKFKDRVTLKQGRQEALGHWEV